MKLVYIANARIPGEKAHPYQIVQMCEAFGAVGADLTLLYPARVNRGEMDTTDIWPYYGVERTFEAIRLPVIELYPAVERLPGPSRRVGSMLAAGGVTGSLARRLMRWLEDQENAVIYTRDALILRVLQGRFPSRRDRMVYEAHVFPASGVGVGLRKAIIRREARVVAVTGHLADRFREIGADTERVMVAHDGYRVARFAGVEGDRYSWRMNLDWPPDAFIVGYLGRLESGLAGMGKGLETLVDALIGLHREGLTSARLALVGGPEKQVSSLRSRLEAAGLPADTLIYREQVPPADVPGYLRAFDVCTIPSPWNDFYAYYTSPLKLFEYMASGTAILASDLPSTAEVIRHEENGLLAPPSDPAAWTQALRRLAADPALRDRLAGRAANDVKAYSWEARARKILDFVGD